MDVNKAQINLRDAIQICKSTLDDLNSNSLLELLRNQSKNFDKALNLIEKYLPTVENMLDQDKADLGIKKATIFLIGLWSRLGQGGSVTELTKDDWNEILGNAAEKAGVIDPKDYSLMVFDLYKKSISFAIEPMRANASESVLNRLEEIVTTMDEYSEGLEAGAMPEAKFIEENLWLSLEAILLVMTDRMSHTLLPEEKRELAEAVSTLVFQKLRYRIYDRELAAIKECLEYQNKLDQRLTKQVNAYIDALKNELDEFDVLVEKAFNTSDLQTAFRGSVDLAESLGAEGTLLTASDVDDYFMS